MKFSGWIFCGALAVLLGLSLSGCMPSSQSLTDEEKEPHFLAGKSAINTMDYKGAIEEFERALKANPESGAAHFEVACLYVQKEPDPAAAIYHFEQYLKLRPDAANAETVRQLIITCKQDLAKTVLPLPITPGMQHQFEQLADENRRLHEENEKWKAYFASRPQTPTNPVGQMEFQARPPVQTQPVQSENTTSSNRPPESRQSAAVTARKHTVADGDTPSSIARKYGVKLDALMAANPGLDPRRLRIGQTLNIPSS
jgi:tetratricopeptide (TPR) repeat protein